MNIKKKGVGFNKNIKNHGLLFHYNIISDPLLVIGYIYIRQIPCSCSECLRIWIPSRIEVSISTIKINTKVKIKAAFIGILLGLTKIGRLFIVLKV